MIIQRVINAAAELQARLDEIGLPFCFIGGIAVQRWGERQLTVDADATVLTGALATRISRVGRSVKKHAE